MSIDKCKCNKTKKDFLAVVVFYDPSVLERRTSTPRDHLSTIVLSYCKILFAKAKNTGQHIHQYHSFEKRVSGIIVTISYNYGYSKCAWNMSWLSPMYSIHHLPWTDNRIWENVNRQLLFYRHVAATSKGCFDVVADFDRAV
ncbi:hypothetical protein BY458DRAFT_487523 [Sporodiniella umbellata]|nr:hypothetical protein BY458DRAFT_487523 [Sporodiniella umbellata]